VKRLQFVFLFLLFIPSGFAQSVLTIEKLEHEKSKNTLKEKEADRGVGYSALAEGIVKSPDYEVYVLVKGEADKAWRLFPATVSPDPEVKGRYRWRAICLFGKYKQEPSGESYQIQAVAFDKTAEKDGPNIHKAIKSAPKTDIVSVKRTK
jgi:hypothetical protein